MKSYSNRFARPWDGGGNGGAREGPPPTRPPPGGPATTRRRRARPATTTQTKIKRRIPRPANSLYNQVMQAIRSKRMLRLSLAAAFVAAGGALSAQTPPAKPPEPAQQQQQPQQPPVIRRAFDIMTTDVIARDNKGQFIADLKKEDFEVYEDGVKQELQSFILTHGGRVYNVAAPPAPPPMEGIILPPSRPT